MREIFSRIGMSLLVLLALLVSGGLPAGLMVWLLFSFADPNIHWVVRLTVTVIGWSSLMLIGYALVRRILPSAWIRLCRIWASPEVSDDG